MMIRKRGIADLGIPLGLIAIGLAGCSPAPDREQTQILPVSEVNIRMTPAGKAEVSKAAIEETPVQGDAEEESSLADE